MLEELGHNTAVVNALREQRDYARRLELTLGVYCIPGDFGQVAIRMLDVYAPPGCQVALMPQYGSRWVGNRSEGVYLARGYCSCDACQAAFRRRAGASLPTEPAPRDAGWVRFRQEASLRPFQRIRDAIDASGRDAALFTCFATTYFLREGTLNLRSLRELADVMAIEGVRMDRNAPQ